MGEDDLRLALLVRRIIENAHRRHVHHHPFTGSRRQDELRGHHHFFADAGQPRVYSGIGRENLLITHIEAPGNVGQSVFLADDGLLYIAHDVVAGVDLETMRGIGLGVLRRGRRHFLYYRGRGDGHGPEQRAAA